MAKLIRITTIPLSLEKLLEGQLTFMSNYFEVTAVSAEEKRLEKYGKENKVDTFHVRMTREITPLLDTKALLKLYFFFKREKPLIVHTHTPKAGIIGMLAAKMARVPIRLHTVAGMPLMESKGAKRQILEQVEKLTYACATKLYPNSKGLRELILKEKLASPEKLKILGEGSSNGIDTQYFNSSGFSAAQRSVLRKTLNIPKEDLIFVFVGRLVADKGINELVEAFISLQEDVPAISLLLVGPFEQELDPIKNNNVEVIKNHSKIFFVGYQEDVRLYFAVSDILVFPSYREGFPNVVMQAGAMGIPSIVTDINGCNEIIKEGVNGTIIPSKDRLALQNAMRRMVEDNGWRFSMQKNTRSIILERYERKHFWQLLLQEYREMQKIRNS